jgi:hypothetical protein
LARTISHTVVPDGVTVIINQNGVDIVDNMFPSIPAFIENAVVDLNLQLNTGGHEELTSAEKATIASWQNAIGE